MTYEQLKLGNQLCFRLYTASRLVTSIYQPYFASLGITYSQYLVLLVLWEKDKQTVCDIAKRLLLETNTVTPLLQRMEKADLLTRTHNKKDTRSRIVSLTQKGKAMQEKAKEIPTRIGGELENKMGNIDELLQIIPTLDKLIDGLSKINKKY